MINTDVVYFAVPSNYFAAAGAAPQAVEHGGRASLIVRAAARLMSSRLDRQLAAGYPATAGALLGAHADRLSSRTERDHLASTMRLMLCWALTPGHRAQATAANKPAIAPKYASIAAAQPTVRRIIALLTDLRRPINPRAIARLRILFSDGAGPLYQGGRASLVEELHVIISLM